MKPPHRLPQKRLFISQTDSAPFKTSVKEKGDRGRREDRGESKAESAFFKTAVYFADTGPV